MAKLSPEEKAKIEQKKSMEKRNSNLIKLYSKVNKKTGERIYSVRKLADQFGMSKSRVHEIVRVVTAK